MKLTNKLTSLIIIGTLLSSLAFTSCKKSNDNSQNSGNAKTSMGTTDGAIDDASVSGVFVTIADIKLDGQSVKGFNETTVDLAAFKNGNIKNIGNFSLQGKSYSTVTFVLDYSKDSNGIAPGAYVLTTDNVKHALTSTTNTITVAKNFILSDTALNAIIADFDLRKMITHPLTGDTASFTFVSAAELQNSVRIVDATESANISGTFTNAIYAADTVIAYVYKAGSFTDAELQGQGASSIQFAHAVTSSVVTAGTYKLSYLDSGLYEIHFASYNDVNHNGKLVLQGMFTANATPLNILSVLLNAKATATVNVTATADVSVN
ncbi:MAG TPA: DUF4382 domain-containing protein [Ferruginibacter sp.]|nr:DUF4382 domain-containing protein [Ferruginibacter sp.]